MMQSPVARRRLTAGIFGERIAVMARIIIGLIIGLGFATACYKIADRKDRSAVLFGVLGFFFTVVTLVVILVLPNRNKVVA
jgi:hypothetical protein